MCLILFAWRAHPRYPLVLAANRDEFHARPTAPADFWHEAPDLLAGRDLQAGGTWLGVTRGGRYAAVTNFREPMAPELPLERSRGDLVRDYLAGVRAPAEQAQRVQREGAAYRGFNLLVGTPGSLLHASNRQAEAREVAPGVHGLSNHLLDTAWPKVCAGRERLQRLLQGDRLSVDDLLDLLADRAEAPGELPAGLEDASLQRHLVNHLFIVSPTYGTRSSTVLLIDADGGISFVERRFAADGSETGTSRFALQAGQTGENG